MAEKTVKERVEEIITALKDEAAILQETFRAAMENFESRTGCKVAGVDLEALEHSRPQSQLVDRITIGLKFKVRIPRLGGMIII